MTNEFQITNKRTQKQNFDLEERTLRFTKNCINICKLMPLNTINGVIIKQLLRAASSVGANYREANDSITKKEFYHRIGTCRKEAKESKYWLELLEHANNKYSAEASSLIDEAFQLVRIFASISSHSKALSNLKFDI